MSFKTKILVSVLVALVTSCSKYTDNDQPPSSDPVQYQNGNEKGAVHCLNSVAPTLKDIFHGTVVDADVDSAFLCLHNTLVEFRDKTDDSSFNNESIVHFFNKYLVSDNQIQKPFEVELLKLKRVFLGGTADTLTRQELDQLIKLFDVVRDELKRVGPKLPLFLQAKTVAVASQADIDSAVAIGQTTLSNLFDQMQIESTDYTLDDMSSFLKELAAYMKGDDVTSDINNFRDLIPFIQTCMNAAFGSSQAQLLLPELKDRTASLVRGYGFYLEYHYNLNNKKPDTPVLMDQWLSFIDRVTDLVEKKSALSTKGLQYNDIKQVFIQMKERKWCPWDIKTETVDATLKVVFGKIGGYNLQNTNPDAITLATWKNIKWEYRQWRLAQKLLAQAPYDAKGYILIPNLEQWMQNAAPIKPTLDSDQGLTDLQKLQLQSSWLELGALVNQYRPIKYNNVGSIMLVDTPTDTGYSQTWTDLLRSNVMRSLTRLLYLGYGNRKQLDLFSSRLTEAKLQEWYTDFTPLGVDLKLFDPRQGNAGSRSYLEANNFTAYSDGVNDIDYNEGYQYVSYLIAGGLVNANNLYDVMKAAGCNTSEIDVLGNPFLNEACFKRTLKNQYGKIFANLPGQVKYVTQLSDADWDKYYNTLMEISRYQPSNAGIKIETSDVRTLVTISHYVESLYTQFDTNRDGILADEEIHAGCTRFLPVLRKVRPGVPDFLLEEGFITLVVNGNLPSVSELAGSIWQGVTSNRTADRDNLLQVILVLRKNMGNP